MGGGKGLDLRDFKGEKGSKEDPAMSFVKFKAYPSTWHFLPLLYFIFFPLDQFRQLPVILPLNSLPFEVRTLVLPQVSFFVMCKRCHTLANVLAESRYRIFHVVTKILFIRFQRIPSFVFYSFYS